MLKAILFDLGDTLFDFEPMDTRAAFELSGRRTHDYLAGKGFRLPSFRRYFWMQYNALRLAYLWSKIVRREFNSFDLMCRLCRRMNLQMDDAALRELCWQWYLPMIDLCSVAPEVIPTLTKFRDRGLKLALVSNTFFPGFVLDRHLAHHGLLEFFPTRIYSSEVGYRKPDARIYRIALGAVGVAPGEAVFVGDIVKTDIVGARGVGMCTILRQPFANSRTHRVADHVVRRISEVHQILPLLGAPAPSEAPLVREFACET